MTHPRPPAPRGKRFVTTHWSLVLAAAGKGTPDADQALATLCECYWYPVYAFVRRQGHSADEAADLTQAFFTRVLEGSYLHRADPARGRFRSFLLACLQHFLSNERDRAQTIKRGGPYQHRSLEVETAEGWYALEPRDEVTPEKLFERRWALTLLDRVLKRVRNEQIHKGKGAAFEQLKEFLAGDAGGQPYRVVARDLGVSEAVVKVTVHRLRRRFRDLLFEEIADTVSDPREVDEEMRYLMQAVSV